MQHNNPKNNPQNDPTNNPVTITNKVIPADEAAVVETESIPSVQKTVAAEAHAVLASNRRREPLITMMPDGTQRIDF